MKKTEEIVKDILKMAINSIQNEIKFRYGFTLTKETIKQIIIKILGNIKYQNGD